MQAYYRPHPDQLDMAISLYICFLRLLSVDLINMEGGDQLYLGRHLLLLQFVRLTVSNYVGCAGGGPLPRQQAPRPEVPYGSPEPRPRRINSHAEPATSPARSSGKLPAHSRGALIMRKWGQIPHGLPKCKLAAKTEAGELQTTANRTDRLR